MEVLRQLDYPAYFDLLEQPLPESHEGILEALANDHLIRPCEAGDWDIANLGALLFAKKLADFRTLARKAVRVIQYRGEGRVETLKERGFKSVPSTVCRFFDRHGLTFKKRQRMQANRTGQM